MENHQTSTKPNIKPNMVYRSPANTYCVVLDVAESATTGAVYLTVQFAHNVGNVRPDKLELSDGWHDKMWRVYEWQPATIDEFKTATENRIAGIHKEIEKLSQMVEAVVGD